MSTYNPDDPRLVQAAQESGLAAEYAADPVLLRLYMTKLFIRGWAGAKTQTEIRYLALARKALGKGPSEAQLATLAAGQKSLQEARKTGGFPLTQKASAPEHRGRAAPACPKAKQGGLFDSITTCDSSSKEV